MVVSILAVALLFALMFRMLSFRETFGDIDYSIDYSKTDLSYDETPVLGDEDRITSSQDNVPEVPVFPGYSQQSIIPKLETPVVNDDWDGDPNNIPPLETIPFVQHPVDPTQMYTAYCAPVSNLTTEHGIMRDDDDVSW